eukprot:scaffold88904_cov28-Tisochrysis_lutea.AAC.2
MTATDTPAAWSMKRKNQPSNHCDLHLPSGCGSNGRTAVASSLSRAVHCPLSRRLTTSLQNSLASEVHRRSSRDGAPPSRPTPRGPGAARRGMLAEALQLSAPPCGMDH